MRSFLIAIAVLVAGLCTTANAQSLPDDTVEPSAAAQTEMPATPPAQVNPYEGDLFTRPYLSGDWNGRRSQLAERGVTWDFFATQFYQGVTTGGLSREFEYGGKLDFLPNFDGQKLGLWQGLSANAHVESRFGTTTNAIGGTLLPGNAAMAFPFEDDPTGVWLTAFKFNQALSEHLILFAGKINGLDGYALKYTPGVSTNLPGLGGFQSIGLTFNPIAARGVPYSAAAAGFAVLFGEGSTLGFSVMDPAERSNRGMDNLFNGGATLATDLVVRSSPLGLPAILNVGGVFTTANYTSLDPSVYLDLLRQGQLQSAVGSGNLPVEDGSWALYASSSQALWQSKSDPKATWGVFGGLGISDGNPNPIKYYGSVGIGGRSMSSARPLDSWGIGYYYVGLSEEIKTLTQSVRPLRDEYGAEAFYNIALLPSCRLTPNLEIARSGLVGVSPPLLFGLRLEMIF
jgi:porin